MLAIFQTGEKIMLKVSFNTSSEKTFQLENIVVDANHCDSEAEAVSQTRKLMEHQGYDKVELKYDGGAISLGRTDDPVVAVNKLFHSNMSVYIPDGANRSGAFLHAESKKGFLVYKCLKDTCRLADIEQKNIVLELNGVRLTAHPDMAVEKLSRQYDERMETARYPKSGLIEP